MRRTILLLPCLCLVAAVDAQRGDPSLEWQKRTVAIDYGVVPLGKHSIDELPVGGQWRMGMNEATTCRAELPLLMSGRALPPGQYRLAMVRVDDDGCEVQFQGSKHALGVAGDLALDGALDEAKKPAKQLAIEWQKGKVEDKQLLAAELIVAFGPDTWHAPVRLVGSSTQKLGGYQLTVFALPAAVVGGRKESRAPIAVLQRGSGKKAEQWNVLLGGDDARLMPWVEVPAANNGFGEIPAPPESLIVKGTLAAEAAAGDAPERALAELVAADLSKGTFTLQFAAGKEVLTATFAEPAKKK